MHAVDYWEFPYPSYRRPILAANTVATSQPLAAQAGLRMLLQGGNAMDAALATAITLTVVEPVMNGIGGDAFALVWADNELHGLNASGRAPAAWTPEFFSAHDTMPEHGWGAVTVPGQVDGWARLSERFGCLSFDTLFQPAIEYAEQGFAVSPVIARQWKMYGDVLQKQPGFADAFLPNGTPPLPGEKWQFAAQAETLKKIAKSKGRDFYEGELAEQIVRFAQETGGALTLKDLQGHTSEWVTPISINYRDDYTVYELPPNGQGIAALMGLGMLNHFEPPQPGKLDTQFHLCIEATKLAFADLAAYVSDPMTMGELAQQLLDPAYLAQRAQLINPDKAGQPTAGIPATGGTIYLAAADSEGMMVSFIQSNFRGFGSGIVVPDTGIALHNRGSAFSLQAGHKNQVGPGKRPMHTIIPGFMTYQGAPLAGFGVMGGNMQAQGHMQLIQHLVDLNHNPQSAIDAPRFRVHESGKIFLEAHTPESTVRALQQAGHPVALQPHDSLDFGAAQVVLRQQHGGYIGATDPRRDGTAVGF